MSNDTVGLGLDEDGWIEQQRGREPYEVVREAVQNSMDTAEETEGPVDIDITVGYGDGYVAVEDDYEDGVKDLSHFYNVFSGSKRDSATKRGRFGRGAKELLAAADRTVIHTTGGTAVFEVVEDDGEYSLEGDIYEDVTADEGTYIMARNDNWDDETLEDVQDYIEDILVPDGARFTVEHIDRSGERPERVTEQSMPEEPDYVMDGGDGDGLPLKTVVYEDGMQQKPTEETEVEVYRTEEGEGGIYEMGIPVTTGEDLPFIFNVQQRTPVAEQRNKIGDGYREDLMQGLINENLDLLEDKELAEQYVTQYLSKYSHKVDEDVQEEYIRRRWDEPDRLLLETDDTTPYAKDLAGQMKNDLAGFIDVSGNNKSRDVRGMLKEHVMTVEGWAEKRNSEEQTEIIEPTQEQQEFMNFVEEELMDRGGVYNVDQEMAKITGGDGGTTRAKSQGGRVLYNVLTDEWEELDDENVGTAIHELAHEETFAGGHGEGWYKTMERLAARVIVDQYEELKEVQEENHELERELEDSYDGLRDYVGSKLDAVKDALTPGSDPGDW